MKDKKDDKNKIGESNIPDWQQTEKLGELYIKNKEYERQQFGIIEKIISESTSSMTIDQMCNFSKLDKCTITAFLKYSQKAGTLKISKNEKHQKIYEFIR